METYVAITFPEIQEYMEQEGFEKNAYLINDEHGINDFGCSAYFVRTEWLKGKIK